MVEVIVITNIIDQKFLVCSGNITFKSEGYDEMNMDYEWTNPLSEEINLVIKDHGKEIKINQLSKKLDFEKKYKYIASWIYEIIQTAIILYLNDNTEVLLTKKSNFKINKIGLDWIFLGIEPE